METPLSLHPWVAERRHRIGFALQAFPELGDQLVATGRLAEELGFDAFFVGDHPGWAHDCWVQLTALALTTERISLGPLVTCAAYRPPVVTARLAADVDRLSKGRLVLGLGIGWDASAYGWGTNEFARLGLPYPPARQRQAALEEAVTIIRGVWGPEPFNFQGNHYTATDVQVDPPPVQRPGPPLVIPGAGERVTLRQVARFADACNFGAGPTGGVDTPDEVRHRFATLRRHCEEVGRPYDDILRSHFVVWLIVAEDEAGVRAKLDRHFPDGLDEVWSRLVVAGTPDTIVRYYQELADAGMQYFVVQVLDPNDEETFRLVAREVAPKIKPVGTEARTQGASGDGLMGP